MACKCTILSSDQLPREASFSCSLKVNIYFSLLLLLILPSLWHSTFRLTKKCSDSDHLSGEMAANKVWLVNMREIFNCLHHQGLGASLDPLWILLSLQILPTELEGDKGFCTSSSESSPAEAEILYLQQIYLLCVQQQRGSHIHKNEWI